MDNTVSVGKNRTGLDMAPMSKDTLIDFAKQEAGRAPSETEAWVDMHQAPALEADRVGTVPVPARLKGVATTAMESLEDNRPQVLIDKLGERLAFERTGVRLYEALIRKVSAASTGPIVDIGRLEKMRTDELEHFRLLARCLADMGADPTAMTPCADVSGVAAAGHLQVLSDPRTTVAQALNSVLMIELGDNASWELLIELVREAGHDDLAKSFGVALQTEQDHLQTVRDWLRQAVMEEAG